MLCLLIIAFGFLFYGYMIPEIDAAKAAVDKEKRELEEYRRVQKKSWFKAGMIFDSLKAEFGLWR